MLCSTHRQNAGRVPTSSVCAVEKFGSIPPRVCPLRLQRSFAHISCVLPRSGSQSGPHTSLGFLQPQRPPGAGGGRGDVGSLRNFQRACSHNSVCEEGRGGGGGGGRRGGRGRGKEKEGRGRGRGRMGGGKMGGGRRGEGGKGGEGGRGERGEGGRGGVKGIHKHTVNKTKQTLGCQSKVMVALRFVPSPSLHHLLLLVVCTHPPTVRTSGTTVRRLQVCRHSKVRSHGRDSEVKLKYESLV